MNKKEMELDKRVQQLHCEMFDCYSTNKVLFEKKRKEACRLTKQFLQLREKNAGRDLGDFVEKPNPVKKVRKKIVLPKKRRKLKPLFMR